MAVTDEQTVPKPAVTEDAKDLQVIEKVEGKASTENDGSENTPVMSGSGKRRTSSVGRSPLSKLGRKSSLTELQDRQKSAILPFATVVEACLLRVARTLRQLDLVAAAYCRIVPRRPDTAQLIEYTGPLLVFNAELCNADSLVVIAAGLTEKEAMRGQVRVFLSLSVDSTTHEASEALKDSLLQNTTITLCEITPTLQCLYSENEHAVMSLARECECISTSNRDYSNLEVDLKRPETDKSLLACSDCNLDDRGGVLVAEFIKNEKELERVELDNNRIGDEGALAILEAVKSNTSVCYLTMEHNLCGEEIVEELHSVVRQNLLVSMDNEYFNDALFDGTRLHKLDQARWELFLEDSSWKDVDLSNVGLRDSQMPALAAILKTTPVIRNVDLSRNWITDAGVAVLAEAVLASSTLLEVSLRNNIVDCWSNSHIKAMERHLMYHNALAMPPFYALRTLYIDDLFDAVMKISGDGTHPLYPNSLTVLQRVIEKCMADGVNINDIPRAFGGGYRARDARNRGDSILVTAVRFGETCDQHKVQRIVAQLLQHGVNANTAGMDSMTALHHCAMQRRANIAEQLLKHDAVARNALAYENSDGECPLELALSSVTTLHNDPCTVTDIVRLFLDYGAPVNHQGADPPLHEGQGPDLLRPTPLHRAVFLGEVDCVHLLLEAGAAPDATCGSEKDTVADFCYRQFGSLPLPPSHQRCLWAVGAALTGPQVDPSRPIAPPLERSPTDRALADGDTAHAQDSAQHTRTQSSTSEYFHPQTFLDKMALATAMPTLAIQASVPELEIAGDDAPPAEVESEADALARTRREEMEKELETVERERLAELQEIEALVSSSMTLDDPYVPLDDDTTLVEALAEVKKWSSGASLVASADVQGGGEGAQGRGEGSAEEEAGAQAVSRPQLFGMARRPSLLLLESAAGKGEGDESEDDTELEELKREVMLAMDDEEGTSTAQDLTDDGPTEVTEGEGEGGEGSETEVAMDEGEVIKGVINEQDIATPIPLQQAERRRSSLSRWPTPSEAIRKASHSQRLDSMASLIGPSNSGGDEVEGAKKGEGERRDADEYRLGATEPGRSTQSLHDAVLNATGSDRACNDFALSEPTSSLVQSESSPPVFTGAARLKAVSQRSVIPLVRMSRLLGTRAKPGLSGGK